MSNDRFIQRAPGVMRLLMKDFDLDKISAAAILGNLGGESRLEAVQEGAPISGRGGFGWAQWTGPRRRAFEAYCERNGYDIKSDEANYKFLYVELKGPESAAITAVKRPGTLEQKVAIFEQKFERAGIPNHAGRIRWAKIALAAYDAQPAPTALEKAIATTSVATAPLVPALDLDWRLIAILVLAALIPLILHKFRKPVEIDVPEEEHPAPVIKVAEPVTKKLGIDVLELPRHLRQIKDALDEALGPLQALAPLTENPPERRLAMVDDTARVEVKSAAESKINWTQGIGYGATLLTIFTGGKFNLTPEQQLMAVTAIQGVQSVATFVMRTFFSKAVVAQSLK